MLYNTMHFRDNEDTLENKLVADFQGATLYTNGSKGFLTTSGEVGESLRGDGLWYDTPINQVITGETITTTTSAEFNKAYFCDNDTQTIVIFPLTADLGSHIIVSNATTGEIHIGVTPSGQLVSTNFISATAVTESLEIKYEAPFSYACFVYSGNNIWTELYQSNAFTIIT